MTTVQAQTADFMSRSYTLTVTMEHLNIQGKNHLERITVKDNALTFTQSVTKLPTDVFVCLGKF